MDLHHGIEREYCNHRARCRNLRERERVGVIRPFAERWYAIGRRWRGLGRAGASPGGLFGTATQGVVAVLIVAGLHLPGNLDCVILAVVVLRSFTMELSEGAWA
jgi:hypothetical protein